MAQEIERKFLVVGDRWRELAEGVYYRQGYLQRQPERTVRVRLAGEQGYLTIKGKSTGISRLEYEYQIPQADALEMLDILCDCPQIEKKRYCIPYEGFIWEVDEFFGENEGLILAEIELQSEAQTFLKPDWIGAEVTQFSRYFNAKLVSYPYSRWTTAEQQLD
ncbi:adenylate cyclase [[Leptolyngbya] sp. PCC 7376]|uniref:CYTH domain-containing protein n=1 Tax=[Leptolyngbya] sp. PCC 7376 TaxID=111781 RepID=UPI00029F1281|nr:CYTH domain-containing protein [[Leptolyngbya] sp. PCC 7376]AFY38306.1 adenylate cyclase [[Leptolyngbya] sp. PCC 7376]